MKLTLTDVFLDDDNDDAMRMMKRRTMMMMITGVMIIKFVMINDPTADSEVFHTDNPVKKRNFDVCATDAGTLFLCFSLFFAVILEHSDVGEEKQRPRRFLSCSPAKEGDPELSGSGGAEGEGEGGVGCGTICSTLIAA